MAKKELSAYTFPVGKIVGFHGLKGEVKIRPETNNPDLLLTIEDVEIELVLPKAAEDAGTEKSRAGEARAENARAENAGVKGGTSTSRGERFKATVDSMRFDKRMLFLRFSGYPDRTAVEHLLNAFVFTSREQLTELDEDEWWVDDLVGLPVYTTNGRLIGTICGIMGTSGELLEVVKEGSESETCLIPFVSALVPVVDMKAKRVEVMDLPGLFD